MDGSIFSSDANTSYKHMNLNPTILLYMNLSTDPEPKPDGEIALSGSYDELCAMGVQEVMPIDEDEEAKKLGGAKSLPSAKDLR